MDFICISTKDFVSFFHVSRWEIDKIECSKKYRTQMRGIELFDAKGSPRLTENIKELYLHLWPQEFSF